MDGRWQARETPSNPAFLLCGRGLVFATAESENGLLSLWLRRHTTALAFGPRYARCKVLPGFRAVQIQRVRPPAAREVLGRGATTTIPHRKIADAERGAMPDGKGRALQVRAGNPNKDNDYLIDRAAQKGEDS